MAPNTGRQTQNRDDLARGHGFGGLGLQFVPPPTPPRKKHTRPRRPQGQRPPRCLWRIQAAQIRHTVPQRRGPTPGKAGHHRIGPAAINPPCRQMLINPPLLAKLRILR